MLRSPLQLAQIRAPRQANAAGATPFYPVVPLGLGSAEVESLTSYLRRLARAHVVRPSSLYTRLIAAVAPGSFGPSRPLTADGAKRSGRRARSTTC